MINNNPHIGRMKDDDPPGQRINPLDAQLGYQLRRASLAMMADLAAKIADLRLSPSDMSVLIVVEANPGITQSEIGRMLSIKRANMVPLTAGLVARDLVRRDPVDRRAQGLHLTAAGRAMAAAAAERVARHEARFLPQLKGRDRAKLIALMSGVWND